MLLGALHDHQRRYPAPIPAPIPANAPLLSSTLTDDAFVARACPQRTPRLLLSSLCDSRLVLSSFIGALCNKSEAQLLPSQASAHSSQKHRDGTKSASSILRSPLATHHSPLTPLKATLTDKHRVLPCFGRNRPPVSLLDSTLTESSTVTPLEATLTKNQGGGGYVC